MSGIEDEKTPKQTNTGVTPVSIEQQCFDKNWILQLNQQEQFEHVICFICKQVANSPIEISCPQHKDIDESTIVGENCLKQFLKTNSNSCPIQPHENIEYVRCAALQRSVGVLKVICPLQFQRESEGQNQINEGIVCDFKGKIKDLNDHLNNVCPLKISNCWYKPFGCEYNCYKYKLNDHLSSEFKFHFDLVVKFIQTLQ
ncbi:hypothetical protein RFI_01475, partial [Reticulomyxa filosa]